MLEAKFYDTYYFCNIIKTMLHYPDDYLRDLHEFYGDGVIHHRISGFRKHSIFHEFIEFIVEDIYYEQTSDKSLTRKKKMVAALEGLPDALDMVKPNLLPIERALQHHNIKHQNFDIFLKRKDKNFIDCDIEDTNEYLHFLRDEGSITNLVEHITKEIFHVLFQNRELMKKFNLMISNALKHETDSAPPEQIEKLFAKPGIFKRIRIPQWVRRAVYFRDHGRCVLCNKDLTALVNLANQENYDHIVPLSNSGFNDVSNIQLLCRECNQVEKKAKPAITSSNYESWYNY